MCNYLLLLCTPYLFSKCLGKRVWVILAYFDGIKFGDTWHIKRNFAIETFLCRRIGWCMSRADCVSNPNIIKMTFQWDCVNMLWRRNACYVRRKVLHIFRIESPLNATWNRRRGQKTWQNEHLSNCWNHFEAFEIFKLLEMLQTYVKHKLCITHTSCIRVDQPDSIKSQIEWTTVCFHLIHWHWTPVDTSVIHVICCFVIFLPLLWLLLIYFTVNLRFFQRRFSTK